MIDFDSITVNINKLPSIKTICIITISKLSLYIIRYNKIIRKIIF